MNANVTAVALAIACAVLSVFVVSRRWAFIGEGISHSGFGGAGTVWAIAAVWSAVDRAAWAPYLGVVLFSLATAWAIAYFTRTGKINSDAVIGILLAASLAWGILAQQLYWQRVHRNPVGWDVFLFGRMAETSAPFAAAAAALCAGVVVSVALLGKELLAYCFDPVVAEASGVRVAFVHYLLLLMIALMIVVGVRIAGSLLVPAMLVLPGATALLFARHMRAVIAGSVSVALVATVMGIVVAHYWMFLPTGPVIVLTLFAQFLAAYAWGKVRSDV